MTTQADRHWLTGAHVYLDGRPAIIGGARNQHATVATLDGQIAHEWAWPTVERIVRERNGQFRS